MTRICWWIVDRVSAMLRDDERDAVLGDFAESGDNCERALRDLLGLIVRRQAALWKEWRPWLALVGLVVPLGMLLCVISRRMADGTAIYVWLYANNWDWTFLANAAFRHDFAHYVSVVFVEYLTLLCWSWISGFVLGSVSRGTLPVTGVLFGLMLLFGRLVGMPPRYLGQALLYRARDVAGNAAVFELTFYRVIFPLIVQAVLVLVPSLWAMRQGLRVTRLRPLLRTILWSAAIVTLAAIAVQAWGLAAVPYNQLGIWVGWQIRMLRIAVYWPVGYLAASAIARRWTHKTVSA
jgi:hypothetical protein